MSLSSQDKQHQEKKSAAEKTFFQYSEENEREVLQALMSIYITMILVDFRTWNIQSIFLPEAVRSYMTERTMKYQDVVPVFCKVSIVESYQKAVEEFLDPDTVISRLEKNGTITMNYIGKKLGWCRVRLIPSRYDDEGHVIGAVFVSEDINKEKKQESEMTYKIEHDYLTGVFNRAAFEKIVLSQSGSLAFLMADVDHFKTYNDTYGHDIGDRILCKVARLLQETFRNVDYVFRFGGDEFAVLLPDCTLENNFPAAVSKVEEINKALSHPTDGLPAATISAGIAFSKNGYDDRLYREADAALYDVKNNGRGKLNAFSEE